MTQEEKEQKIQYLNSLLPRDKTDSHYVDVNGNKAAYANDPNLLYPNTKLPLTSEHVTEIQKCANDIIYFVENYVRIRSLDAGLIFPELRDYQKDLLKQFQNNRFNIVLAGRQSGKSVTTVLYLLWKCCFVPESIIGICANKYSMASENYSRLRDMYYELPIWIKPGVISFGRETFSNEIGCKVYISATTDSAFRGYSIGTLFIDECFADTTRVVIRDSDSMVEREMTVKELYDSLT